MLTWGPVPIKTFTEVFIMGRKLLAGLLTFGGLALAQTGGSGSGFGSITVDLSPVWTLAGTIVGALATLIVVRKGIKLVNRS